MKKKLIFNLININFDHVSISLCDSISIMEKKYYMLSMIKKIFFSMIIIITIQIHLIN